MIENDDFKFVIKHGVGDFLCLAGTDKQGGVRAAALAGDGDKRLRASRLGQQGKLFKTRGKVAFAEVHSD